MSDLLPCPFCGGEAEMHGLNTVLSRPFVACEYCGAESAVYRTEAEAIAAWNTRAERTCKIYRVGNTQDLRKCSACGALMSFSHPLDRSHLNYCPNCGAKVIGD